MEKISSLINYLIGLILMWFGRHTPQDIAFMVGSGVAVVTLVINVATFLLTGTTGAKPMSWSVRNCRGEPEPDR